MQVPFEIPPAHTITFAGYGALAHMTSLVGTQPEPDAFLHGKFLSEKQEVFMEGGKAQRFAFLYGFTAGTDEDKAGIASEFGDNMWCISEAVNRRGGSLGLEAASAAERHTGLAPDGSISFFDALATYFAHDYYVNMYKNMPRDLSQFTHAERRLLTERTITQSPGYVLERVLGRHALRTGDQHFSNLIQDEIPSNLAFEPPELIEQGSGDSLWVMAIIANYMLGTSLASIAVHNLVKVRRRQITGTLLGGDDPERSRG